MRTLHDDLHSLRIAALKCVSAAHGISISADDAQKALRIHRRLDEALQSLVVNATLAQRTMGVVARWRLQRMCPSGVVIGRREGAKQ